MPELQTSAGRPITGPIVVVAGTFRRLKIVGKRGERMPFTVTVTRAPTAAIDRLEPRLSAHFATFRLRGLTAGDTEIEISAAAGAVPLRVGVRVLASVSLPEGSTDAGMLTRLLLAETRAPGGPGYSLEAATEAMQLMRLVLENRLKTPSGRWASQGARTLRDVVRSPGQFAGFEGYPTLSSGMTQLIDNMVAIANDAGDGRSQRMRAHIEAAIGVARGPVPRDPTNGGVYWWRTEGSGSPGTGISVYKTVLGNTFYSEGR
jgi:hypothetical protein